MMITTMTRRTRAIRACLVGVAAVGILRLGPVAFGTVA